MSMHRELNPQLFGTQAPAEKIGQTVDQTHPAHSIMGKNPENPGAGGKLPYPSIDIKAIEHQVATLRLALMQMEKRTEAVSSKIDELGRGVHARLERFSQAITRVEDIQSQNQQDATGKFAQIAARVNERKVTDSKVQELIDRHNTIIRNFENRLLSLQRIVTEQEMALHNAQAALEESRAELSKRHR
jgi:chromosome segregation ATPase